MNTQKAPARSARGLPDVVIEKRYLDLQRLRDAVRMAEMNSSAMKKTGHRKAVLELISSSAENARPNFGG
jgi:hypothetical protein